MKHSKLIIVGLTAAITMTGASAVFAEETGNIQTEGISQIRDMASGGQKESGVTVHSGMLEGIKNGFLNGQNEEGKMPGMIGQEEIDMSGLDLPEDFVPFDEAHVPDGLNIPENGELKPIEFDEDGNMTYGLRPPMSEEFNGERPELPEGGMPFGAENAKMRKPF